MNVHNQLLLRRLRAGIMRPSIYEILALLITVVE